MIPIIFRLWAGIIVITSLVSVAARPDLSKEYPPTQDSLGVRLEYELALYTGPGLLKPDSNSWRVVVYTSVIQFKESVNTIVKNISNRHSICK